MAEPTEPITVTHEPVAITAEPVPTSVPEIQFTPDVPAPTIGITFTETNQTPPPTETPATPHIPAPVEVPDVTFANTSTPPPEATIAPEVPTASQRTGWINKLKSFIGK